MLHDKEAAQDKSKWFPQKQPRLDKRSLGLHVGSGTVPEEYEPEQFKHRCKGSVYLFSTTTVWQHTGIEKNW